jgi:hypothetical protein
MGFQLLSVSVLVPSSLASIHLGQPLGLYEGAASLRMHASRCFWSKLAERKMHAIIIATVPSNAQHLQGFINLTGVLTSLHYWLNKSNIHTQHKVTQNEKWRLPSEPRPLRQLPELTTKDVNRSWHSRAAVHTVHRCDSFYVAPFVLTLFLHLALFQLSLVLETSHVYP